VECDAVLNILQETRAFLAQPDNNFAWSGWANREAALKDIDSLIASIGTGAVSDPTHVAWLFAPTGPLQEVSVSSGWGERFLDLARRMDAATR
jgi:hypothetical protein